MYPETPAVEEHCFRRSFLTSDRWHYCICIFRTYFGVIDLLPSRCHINMTLFTPDWWTKHWSLNRARQVALRMLTRVVLPQTNQWRRAQPPQGAPLHRPLRQAASDRPAAAGGGENLFNWTMRLSATELLCFSLFITFCFLFFFFGFVFGFFFADIFFSFRYDTFGLFRSVILCSVSLCLFGFGRPPLPPPPSPASVRGARGEVEDRRGG